MLALSEPALRAVGRSLELDIEQLSAAERDLLRLIYGLQRKSGTSWASLAYLAVQVGRSERQIRRLINGRTRDGKDVPGLVEKGYLLATTRRGQPTLYRLSEKRAKVGGETVGKRVLGADPNMRFGSGVPRTPGPPRGGPPGPPIKKFNKHRRTHDSARGSAPLFEEQVFNVFQPLSPGDRMNAAGRWAFAFRQRAFLFMVHQGRKRLIVAAAYNATSCIATLAVEADPEQVEEVVFPVSELTSHKFWR